MATQVLPETQVDTFPINGTDYIEFYVGNAKQSAIYYQTAFGFTLKAYRGPETGVRDRASYLLEQNKLRFVLTTPLGPDGPIAEHVRAHGDGVRDLAFWVDDARDAFAKAVERGAEAVQEPTVLSDADGEVVIAAIKTYGDTIHSIVERRNYRGVFPARVQAGQFAACHRQHRAPLRRSLRRQRRTRTNEPLGCVL